MSKKIIIHGHFYQPPRENPNNGLISFQESAAPEINWNHRICKECYTPFAASQVLDENGLVKSVINLYEYVSFNFGSNLLDWMERYETDTYEKILQADGESQKRLGYGNAIAMGYNHTILPLDDPRDARTQIRWGLTDFRERFGRDSEGIWLPECAVNNTVLDILVDEGVRFIILSPWQANSISINGSPFRELHEHPAPSDRPFLIERPGGSIIAFFYHPDMAANISFNHLLRSHSELKSSLNSCLDQNNMVSIATDGEIYGHHEPHGHMCLSHLIYEQTHTSKPEFEFTNYSAVLHENKPRDQAIISEGEKNMGSSWSCFHGVGRWTRNCGCSTGGDEHWNQKWRLPLRQSFNSLRDNVRPVLEATLSAITNQNPQKLLRKYIHVMNGRMDKQDFARLNLIRNNEKNRESLLTLLEGAKYLQFMYTSCAWFFSELTGLETIQNIAYAVCAAELLEKETGHEGLRNELCESLGNVMGNLKTTGKDIVQNELAHSLAPHVEAAAVFFWQSQFYPDEQIVWGTWKLKNIHYNPSSGDKGCISFENQTTDRKYITHFRLFDSSTRSASAPNFRANRLKGKSAPLFPRIELKLENNSWQTVNISQCEQGFRITMCNHIANTLWKDFRQSFSPDRILPYLGSFSLLGLPLPRDPEFLLPLEMTVILNIEFLAESSKTPGTDDWKKGIDDLREILGFCEKKEFGNGELLEKKLLNLLKQILTHSQRTNKGTTEIFSLIAATRKAGFDIKDMEIQESFFSILREVSKPSLVDDEFLRMAHELGVSPEMILAN